MSLSYHMSRSLNSLKGVGVVVIWHPQREIGKIRPFGLLPLRVNECCFLCIIFPLLLLLLFFLFCLLVGGLVVQIGLGVRVCD